MVWGFVKTLLRIYTLGVGGFMQLVCNDQFEYHCHVIQGREIKYIIYM